MTKIDIRSNEQSEISQKLLKALKALIKLYEDDEGCRSLPEYKNAIAAISKAEGLNL